jgi:YegS/Rv2252/BmrU family lipid kinase
MKRKAIFIYNPVSGTRSKDDLRLLVVDRLKHAGIMLSIFPSVASGDYSFLLQVIKEENITDILIAGGDGTINQVIGNLRTTGVNFGIIPCGSGNGLALAAGIPVQPQKAIDNFINGEPALLDGFMVNNKFACMLCGLGFDAKVAHEFARQPKRGLGTYINQVVKNFLAARSYQFGLKLNGNQFDTEAFFISVANSNQFGNNFTIAPKASLVDGLLDVVIVCNQNKLSVILQTLKQVAGWNKLQTQSFEVEKKGILYFQTNVLTVTNMDEAPLHIDGDPAETESLLKFEILPLCFSLIQPLKVRG